MLRSGLEPVESRVAHLGRSYAPTRRAIDLLRLASALRICGSLEFFYIEFRSAKIDMIPVISFLLAGLLHSLVHKDMQKLGDPCGKHRTTVATGATVSPIILFHIPK